MASDVWCGPVDQAGIKHSELRLGEVFRLRPEDEVVAAGVERVQDEDVGGGDRGEGRGQEGGHQERARHPAASGALQRVAARVAVMISLP